LIAALGAALAGGTGNLGILLPAILEALAMAIAIHDLTFSGPNMAMRMVGPQPDMVLTTPGSQSMPLVWTG
jgi:hypothetical protein